MDRNTDIFADKSGGARVDGYSEPGPRVSDLLIVSLSTFPDHKDINKSVYTCQRPGLPEETGEYFYQQEPFPRILRDRLRENGEILMLASAETLKAVSRSFEGETLVQSPRDYFVERVRRELGGVSFRSVALDMDDPTGAVSEVVSHLREITRNNGGAPPRIHLGTNGGLRSNQLILEAVLSLLKSDAGGRIRIRPEDVWSMMPIDRNKWKVFNSAAEFRIFDLVAGINEFVRYGRVSLLEEFWRKSDGDPAAVPSAPAADGSPAPDAPAADGGLALDGPGRELMKHIKTIADGIQLNNVVTLENGIRALRGYFFRLRHGAPASADPYIGMFINAIQEDYGALMRAETEADLAEPPGTQEEIAWCVKKGFYMQACTLAETRMPVEFFRTGLIRCDQRARETAVLTKRFPSQDPLLALFNKIISDVAPKKDGKVNLCEEKKLEAYHNGTTRTLRMTSKPYDVPYKLTYHVTVPQAYDDLILQHFRIKDRRNQMCHPEEADEASASEAIDALLRKYQDAIAALRARPAGSAAPIELRLLDDGGWFAAQRVVCTISSKELICRQGVSAAELNRVESAVISAINGERPRGSDPQSLRLKASIAAWLDALEFVGAAGSVEDFTRNLDRAMPVLRLIALKKISGPIRNAPDDVAVKWEDVVLLRNDREETRREKQANWLLDSALTNPNVAPSVCRFFLGTP